MVTSFTVNHMACYMINAFMIRVGTTKFEPVNKSWSNMLQHVITGRTPMNLSAMDQVSRIAILPANAK